ncbi:aminotransferase class V-fold PLP-dependent enzyme [Embleya sp. NPDC055664]
MAGASSLATTSSPRAEYAGNAIVFLQTARRPGVQIDVVPDHETGRLPVDALRGMLDERLKLIAITHVPTQGGLVNPAEAGRVANAAGITYLLDACQSVGQLPVDVAEIGCDLLSATGRKFLRGPRGTGFLYCLRRLLADLEPPFLDLQAATWTSADGYEIRDDARRFETWETNYAGKIGLGVAVDYMLDIGMGAVKARNDALAECPGVTLRETSAPNSARSSRSPSTGTTASSTRCLHPCPADARRAPRDRHATAEWRGRQSPVRKRAQPVRCGTRKAWTFER